MALWEEPLFQYLIMGKEVGDSGTPHLQGYAEFTKKAKWAPLAKKHKMHVETAKGTQEEAITYCKKEGDWAEKGTPKGGAKLGGQKNLERWEDAWEKAKVGDLDAIPKDILIRNYRTFKEIAKDYMETPEALIELRNLWLCGPAGVGKTRLADMLAPGSYSKNCNKWWDGYQNQAEVIINDVGKEHSVLGHHFKLWGEHRPFIAETKGGALHIRPKRIIVTSQYRIEDIWEDQETRDAIKRRFKQHHLQGEFSLENLTKIKENLA